MSPLPPIEPSLFVLSVRLVFELSLLDLDCSLVDGCGGCFGFESKVRQIIERLSELF